LPKRVPPIAGGASTSRADDEVVVAASPLVLVERLAESDLEVDGAGIGSGIGSGAGTRIGAGAGTGVSMIGATSPDELLVV
jgi:hypothetical protein